MIANKQKLEAVYSRLIANCDKAIDQSKSEWAHNFWTQTKQKLFANMNKLGLLNNKTIH